jgi:hypothetical protein
MARSVGGLCAPVSEKSPSKNARHAPGAEQEGPRVPLPYWSRDLLYVHIRKLDPSLTRFSAASTTGVGNPTWALEACGAALVPLATS